METAVAETTHERIAGILWSLRSYMTDDLAGVRFRDVSPEVRERYRRLAVQVAKQLANVEPGASAESGERPTDGEVERLRAELDETAGRLDAAWTVISEGTDNMRAQLATVRAERDAAHIDVGLLRDERDRLAEQVKRVEALRDRWEAATRDASGYSPGGVVHAAALAASHLPDLCRALEGTEAGRG
jgi:hypothetical protein